MAALLGLGRKQRLEKPGEHLLVHPETGIDDPHLGIGPGSQATDGERVLIVPRDRPRLEAKLPAVRHGIPRVEHQVEQCGLQESSIAPRDETALDIQPQTDLGGQDVVQDRHQFANRLLERHVLPRDAAGTTEREDAGGDDLGLTERALGFFHHLGNLGVHLVAAQDHLEIIEIGIDHPEQVVEVVGHAARQMADGLPLLRADQGLLQLGLELPGDEALPDQTDQFPVRAR